MKTRFLLIQIISIVSTNDCNNYFFELQLTMINFLLLVLKEFDLIKINPIDYFENVSNKNKLF